ncbi:MAG: hypothetical protein PQJ46_03660, partial [Spirochaetales bacterium]|nr:hypothetical protein [Spirochaetales bacterium]
MMHLPALEKAGLIEKALKAVVQIGVTVKGFMSDDNDHSLGSMYQISNQFTIGQTEKEIIQKLEKLSEQLSGYERTARTEIYEKKKTEIDDAVFRAFGLLTNCRLLTSTEAISNLLTLRLGICLGLINIPLELCTSLVFLCQKSHIEKIALENGASTDETIIDMFRADFIRTALNDKKIN